jgi:hypothetical protein
MLCTLNIRFPMQKGWQQAISVQLDPTLHQRLESKSRVGSVHAESWFPHAVGHVSIRADPGSAGQAPSLVFHMSAFGVCPAHTWSQQAVHGGGSLGSNAWDARVVGLQDSDVGAVRVAPRDRRVRNARDARCQSGVVSLVTAHLRPLVAVEGFAANGTEKLIHRARGPALLQCS